MKSATDFPQNDSGNVLLEFIWVVVALLIPVSYISTACWNIAQQQLALTSAAHAASRAVVLSATEIQARERMRAVVQSVLAERLEMVPDYALELQCPSHKCLIPGSLVTVRVKCSTEVWVPLVGTYKVRLSASDTSVVDEYS